MKKPTPNFKKGGIVKETPELVLVINSLDLSFHFEETEDADFEIIDPKKLEAPKKDLMQQLKESEIF